jgi:hypothetical protein
MASVDTDYGNLFLQRRDPNPIKKHLNLYARRRLRRALSIARDPLPLLRRKVAARSVRLAENARNIGVRIDPAKGYLTLPPGFIRDIEPVIEIAHRKWREYREKMASTNHYFLKFSMFMPKEEFAEAVNVALQRNVLRLTSDYIGSLPVLKDLNIWWTRPSSERTGAQNWHIDSIPDTHSLRFFVALTDIDKDNGPLNFLDAAKSKTIVEELGYLGGAIDAAFIERHFKSDIKVASYKQGEAVALDTARCLHCGSTNMKKDRLMLSISFSSYYLAEPFTDQKGWQPAVKDLNEVNRLVLNL